MSNWKVSREQIELFPHPGADALEIGRVGNYQVVVQKGQFQAGQTVLFVPEKSLLPDKYAESVRNYLAGPDKNRVKAIRLRGEPSCGLILADECQDAPIGLDISARLGITKYEPPIPFNMAGKVRVIDETRLEQWQHAGVSRHDCEHYSAFEDELLPDETVIVTEKIHGSQFIAFRGGDRFVTSKGLLKRGLCIEEDEGNLYWRAFKAVGGWGLLDTLFPPDASVQLFGEAFPCQRGFRYGQERPTLRFFKIKVNGKTLNQSEIPVALLNLWVPIIYQGPLDKATVRQMAEGMEQVSGKELHIREGVVVCPLFMRSAKNGTRLQLKILNPKYKETGEELD